MALSAPSFRFDSGRHEYVRLDTGELVPHITGLLKEAGLVDDTWFTEESSERGTAVHRLASDYDLGILDLSSCQTAYRGYLMAHVACVKALNPEWLHIEEPVLHSAYKFAGRPDRVATIFGARAILELKTGQSDSVHRIQTALQAILDSERAGIPAEHLVRYCAHYKPSGKFTVHQHVDRRDLDIAYGIIRRFCL